MKFLVILSSEEQGDKHNDNLRKGAMIYVKT